MKKTIFRIALSIVLCIIIYLLPIQGIWRMIAFLIPYLIIGYDVLWGAIHNIFEGEIFDEEFLMSIATIGAIATGNYVEAAAVMIFYQTGELFQNIAVGKSRKSISSLMDIRPDHAVVLRNGEELTVSPDEVKVGETLIVKPGEKIPLDGVILEGSTFVNTSALTGESKPLEKVVGDKVISGSINSSGLIKVKAESLYNQSTVAKILELVENASDKKARVEAFITRFSRIYTPTVCLAALLLGVIPPLFFGQSWSMWLNRALIFLVVSCPCALVISVPLSFFGGIGGAAQKGILIKGANYLETFAQVKTIVFDKTGTLTKGVFKVVAIHSDMVSEAELLDIAAAAESYSKHPVAESIILAHGGHIDKNRIQKTIEHAGMGIEAIIDGNTYFVGNSALMKQAGAVSRDCHLMGTTVHISRGDQYLGHIIINDEVKPEAKAAVGELKELGITKTVMLSGDDSVVAEAVGSEIGIDEVHARLFPADKVAAVEKLLSPERKLAFVGDGINDAPVLMRADVGIAMGALGSDAAIEAADIVLMDDNLSKLALSIRISRKTMRIVRQNIIFALAVKFIILFLSAFGLTNMWVAVFGDVGVMILAILNALRAMRIDR